MAGPRPRLAAPTHAPEQRRPSSSRPGSATKGAEEARPGKGGQMRLQVVVVVDGVVVASHADSSLKNKIEFFGKSKTRTRITMD